MNRKLLPSTVVVGNLLANIVAFAVVAGIALVIGVLLWLLGVGQ